MDQRDPDPDSSPSVHSGFITVIAAAEAPQASTQLPDQKQAFFINISHSFLSESISVEKFRFTLEKPGPSWKNGDKALVDHAFMDFFRLIVSSELMETSAPPSVVDQHFSSQCSGFSGARHR